MYFLDAFQGHPLGANQKASPHPLRKSEGKGTETPETAVTTWSPERGPVADREKSLAERSQPVLKGYSLKLQPHQETQASSGFRDGRKRTVGFTFL